MMFSTISRPESVSQPSSAVLNRFSSLQESNQASSPLSSLYTHSPALTPTIASPALPRAFASQLNSPRNQTFRNGRTHTKSKTCHGFGELLKVPSSPSDLIVSPGQSGSSVSSPLSTWSLKSPSTFVHRQRSNTTTAASLVDSRNQHFGQVPYLHYDQQPPSNFHHEPQQPYMMMERSPGFPLVDTTPNNAFFGQEAHAQPPLELIPIESGTNEAFSSPQHNNISDATNNQASPPAIEPSAIVPASKTSLSVSRGKPKQPKVGHRGVHRTNSKDQSETAGSSEAPVVTITAGGYARKYACTWEGCGKAFTTSGHLARHNRIHTGEKRYECLMADCHSRFSRQDNMLQHYRTHLSGKCRRLPSVSSVASSNEGGKSFGRVSREKPLEGSPRQDGESQTSSTRLEDFTESMSEMDYAPSVGEPFYESMLAAPPPALMYDDMGQPMPYLFSNYPPFDSQLTLEAPDGYHSHEMSTYLAPDRGFASSSSSWPYDLQNQIVVPDGESDHEPNTSFGNSFTNMQYSLPSLIP